MYDVDRLIESLTILYHNDNIPKLAVKSGGVQALEEFVLARYFMFIQVYFHRTRRYFDIMLQRALELVLPDGKYPENVDEYLKWDDCRVIQLLKEHENEFEPCRNIVRRVVYPRVYKSKTHPSPADIREFKRNCIELKKIVGEENLIIDTNADKMPHRIPINAAIGDEKSIPIFDSTQNQVTTIAEESEIIVSLSKKINIQRVYCNPICSQKAIEYIKSVNKEIDEE